MNSQGFRQYIDILQELELPQVSGPDSDVQDLQQSLLDAGFELPRFGADGKMGPETRAAIKAAEMVLGRKPTGQLKPEELEGLQQRIANNNLTQALGAIESILAKYKIKAEGIHPDDALVLENISNFTLQEQMEIWQKLVEADIYVPPSSGGRSRDAGTQARMQMARNTNPAIARANDPFGQIGRSSSMPEPSVNTNTGKLDKFLNKLGGKQGIAKKIAGRGVASLASGPAAAIVGTGLLAWTAWDVGKALYDTFAKTEMEDLDPTDQKIISDNLQTVMSYQKDPKLMSTLPDDLQARVARAARGLNALAANAAAPSTSQSATTSPDAKPADRVKDLPSPVKSNTSTQGILIAGEPVIPGQPLSRAQMGVMKMALDMGNSYSPEIMAQYNKQRRDG